MAIKHYLIPIDESVRTNGSEGVQPKYLNIINCNSKGLIPKETTTDFSNRTWLRGYYVVQINTNDPKISQELEKKPDVIRVDDIDLAKIAAIGIDTSGLSVASAKIDKEKAVVRWLTGDEVEFAKVL